MKYICLISWPICNTQNAKIIAFSKISWQIQFRTQSCCHGAWHHNTTAFTMESDITIYPIGAPPTLTSEWHVSLTWQYYCCCHGDVSWLSISIKRCIVKKAGLYVYCKGCIGRLYTDQCSWRLHRFTQLKHVENLM